VRLTRPQRRLALGGGAMLLAAFLIGAWSFAQRAIAARLSVYSTELDTVNRLKALQLSEWHRERIDDAYGRAADPFLVASVRDWLAGRRPPGLEERIQVALAPRREPWRYLNIWLLDAQGNMLFDARRQGVAGDFEPGLLESCLQARRPVFGLLRSLDTSAPFVDLCMAVVDLTQPQAAPAAVEIYRADASQLLLPSVRFSPRGDASVITTVLRFEGTSPQVVVSSGSLAPPGAAPVLVPEGFLTPPHVDRIDRDVTGRDGRRRIVVSAAVQNTPWTIIAGIERSRPVQEAYEDIGVSSLLVSALVAIGYLSFLLASGRREQETAKDVLRLDRLLQIRSAINEAIVRIRDRGIMLSRFCELAVSLGRFQLAAVFDWRNDHGTARLAAWHGELPRRFATEREFPVGDDVRQGPARALFDRGAVAIIPDLKDEPQNQWTKALLADGHRAVVALPIREAGLVTGSFWMYSAEPDIFDRRDLQFFDELAADINYALENLKAEDYRREVELQLQAVSDAAPFAIFLITQDSRRIERANSMATRQYGYSEAELVGQSAAIIFAPHDLEPSLPLGDGGAGLPTTATHTRKDRTQLIVEITTRPSVVGGVSYDLVVAADVTARRQLEEQFRQAQRLEAVGKLAGGIAHDFNNLLTVISGFAAFILEDIPENDPNRNAAEQIQIAARRAADLTRSLLAFSRRQTMQSQYVHLNDIVRETAAMLSRVISEDIVLTLQLEATRDGVNVDPSQMQQVLMNLSVNARDAMKMGGRLTIATRDLDGYVELRVTDTGEGIAPAVREHIFEPFFTTKAAGEGTGLGLPTVHGIVTQSGGTISVESDIGRGTTFVIVLPGAERTPEPAQAAAPAAPRRTGKGTVLLVEDDAGVRELATTVLTRGGYEVVAYANGAAALDRASAGPIAVDVVLTDVVMPGFSGPELIQRLRGYYPQLPVIYMSGYAEEAATRLQIDTRTLNLLNKPFAPHDLLQRVDAALGNKAK
jgi:PAS domain S-box-containing protein